MDFFSLTKYSSLLLIPSFAYQARPHPGEVFAPIHEFSRHSIHVAEVLEAAVEVMTEIQRCRSEVYENLPSNLGDTYKQQAREYAQFQISIVKNLKLRSDSNRARLADEINLVRCAHEATARGSKNRVCFYIKYSPHRRHSITLPGKTITLSNLSLS